MHPKRLCSNLTWLQLDDERQDQTTILTPSADYLADSAASAVLTSVGHWDTYGLSCKNEKDNSDQKQ